MTRTGNRRAVLLGAIIGLGGVALVLILTLRSLPPTADTPAPVTPRAAPRADVTVPPPRFTDITRGAGIDFVHRNGAAGESLLPETMGGGVAFFDADSDQDMDLLLVSSGTLSGLEAVAEAAPPVLHLYLNDGTGQFEDATAGSGLEFPGYGMGVAAGDVDGDGLTDLFVTAVGANALFRNRGDGRFENATADAGVGGDAGTWSSSAAFMDVDLDGDLDLFVTNYVEWSRELDLAVDYRLAGIGRAYGPPANYPGTFNYLYRNDGAGRFTDVSEASGIRIRNRATGAPVGKGLAVLPADLNGDGWPDLVVANDTVGNFLLLNRGDGTFAERGTESGLAYDNTGAATGAMGIDAAWFDNDTTLAIAIGNFANEMTSFYVGDAGRAPNALEGVLTSAAGEVPGMPPAPVDAMRAAPGLPLFTDEAAVSGIGASSRRALTFGVLFFDYDLDGRQDYLQVNGHVEDEISLVQPGQRYAQPAQLFWNCGRRCQRTFVPVPAASLGDLAQPIVGRGAAYADIDADGDLDLAITAVGGAPLLLRNDTPRGGHHWLRVRLRQPGGNPVGIGARVLVPGADGQTQQRLVTRARSYLSQVEPVASFGLGPSPQVPPVTVIWPDGAVQVIQGLQADTDNLITRTVTR